MLALEDVPLLAQLPRVELAKLVSDIQRIVVARGEGISLADESTSFVYFIFQGRMGLYLEVGDRPTTLLVLGGGEVLRAVDPEFSPAGSQFTFRAVEDAVLLRLEESRFESILTQHPGLLRQFNHAMIRRSSAVLEELARTKTALLLHAEEVWASLEDSAEAFETATEEQAAAAVVEDPSIPARKPFPWRTLTAHLLPLVGAAMVLTAGGTNWSLTPTRGFLAILVWGVGSWLFDILPDYVVALSIGLISTLTGIVSQDVSFSGFSSRTWFLLLAVLGISAGISRTGLLYRVALHMLRLFPPTYNGQSSALALGGLVLAPFLPGVTGRQVMASRLSLELSEAMRFKPNSREATGLAMACFLGFSCIYYISLTGGSVTLLVWSILPQAAKATLSWSSWFLAALPISLFVFAVSLGTILLLYRPRQKVHIAPELVESQLRVLGPMGRAEWTTVWIVLAIVGAFITQPLHGVDPTWVALPGFLLLAATGIMDKDLLKKGIDWSFLLLTGGLLGIATITEKSGFVTAVSGAVAPLVEPLAGHPWLFFTGVGLLTALIHLAVPFQPTILLTSLALAPVADRMGYSPFVVGLVVLVMASHFVVPHGNPMYLAALGGTEGRCFNNRQVRALSLIHAAITLVGIWVCIPYWSWLGLIR